MVAGRSETGGGRVASVTAVVALHQFHTAAKASLVPHPELQAPAALTHSKPSCTSACPMRSEAWKSGARKPVMTLQHESGAAGEQGKMNGRHQPPHTVLEAPCTHTHWKHPAHTHFPCHPRLLPPLPPPRPPHPARPTRPAHSLGMPHVPFSQSTRPPMSARYCSRVKSRKLPKQPYRMRGEEGGGKGVRRMPARRCFRHKGWRSCRRRAAGSSGPVKRAAGLLA